MKKLIPLLLLLISFNAWTHCGTCGVGGDDHGDHDHSVSTDENTGENSGQMNNVVEPEVSEEEKEKNRKRHGKFTIKYDEDEEEEPAQKVETEE